MRLSVLLPRQYLTLYLEDSPNQDIVRILYDVFEFIEKAHASASGGSVLVHCTQGISRSAALCIAYIMYNRKVPYDEAFKGVKSIRGVSNPNIGFTCQLLHWQKQLNPATREPHNMYVLRSPLSPSPPLALPLFR